MRRRTMMVVAAVCGAFGFACLKHAPTAGAQQGVVGDAPHRVISHRKVAIEFTNATERHGRPCVTGEDKLPLRLKVTDEGSTSYPRRLQVLVALYVKPDPDSMKMGKRFFLKTDPRVLTTAPGKSNEAEFEWDIPLLPGDYVAHVFLCDPDQAQLPIPETARSFFPEPEDLPGRVKRATAMAIHVDPAGRDGNVEKK